MQPTSAPTFTVTVFPEAFFSKELPTTWLVAEKLYGGFIRQHINLQKYLCM